MPSRKPPQTHPQELLALMDDYLTALYHQRHDPTQPPELTYRGSRLVCPADLRELA